MLHTKTRKVTTYGRQKTRIIQVLPDLSLRSPSPPRLPAPQSPTLSSTPSSPVLLPTTILATTKRPPLKSLASQPLLSPSPTRSRSHSRPFKTPDFKQPKPKLKPKTYTRQKPLFKREPSLPLPTPSPPKRVVPTHRPKPVSTSSASTTSTLSSTTTTASLHLPAPPLRALPVRSTAPRKRIIETPSVDSDEEEDISDPEWEESASSEDEEEEDYRIPVRRQRRAGKVVKPAERSREETRTVGGKSRKTARRVISSPDTSLEQPGEDVDAELVAGLSGLKIDRAQASREETSLTSRQDEDELEELLAVCGQSCALGFQEFLETHDFSGLRMGLARGTSGAAVERRGVSTRSVVERSKSKSVNKGKGKIDEQGPARRFKKVGEASFSEVYSVPLPLPVSSETDEHHPGAVMKVVPLKPLPKEDGMDVDGDEDDGVCLSSLEDVRREIEITRRMSGGEGMDAGGGGFVRFYGAFVVQGVYPEALLEEWDAFEEERGSDSIRPDSLPPTQRFAIILLENGGTDLEHFQFGTGAEAGWGWRQAVGVVAQVVGSLERGEKLGRFEHRDLHEGQILIKPSPTPLTLDSHDPTSPEFSGLQTSIIDFGLSRVDMEDGRVFWTGIPEEVFEGEGEQWDVYRRMRAVVEGGEEDEGWEGFFGVTNVMWIHHLLRVILHNTPSLQPPKSKTLSAVLARRDPSRSPIRIKARAKGVKGRLSKQEREERELESWEFLRELEGFLAGVIGFEGPGGKKAGRKGKKGKGRKDAAAGEGAVIGCAGDVLSWAEERGWRGT